MKRVTVTLETGLRLGPELYDQVSLREATVGDEMDAEESSANPFVKAVELLARQVEYLTNNSGSRQPGPLTRPMVRMLTSRDMELLAKASEELQKRERVLAAAGGLPDSRSTDRTANGLVTG